MRQLWARVRPGSRAAILELGTALLRIRQLQRAIFRSMKRNPASFLHCVHCACAAPPTIEPLTEVKTIALGGRHTVWRKYREAARCANLG